MPWHAQRLLICGQALYTFSTVCAQTSDFARHAAGFKLSAEPSRALDDQDKDVLIAVRALGDMRSRAVTLQLCWLMPMHCLLRPSLPWPKPTVSHVNFAHPRWGGSR